MAGDFCAALLLLTPLLTAIWFLTTPGGSGPPLLRGTDLAVTPGANLLVVGANGAGKTALLRALGGAPLGAGERRARARARVASVSFDTHRRFVAAPARGACTRCCNRAAARAP